MSERMGGRLPWILVVLLACLWAAGFYRSHLLQQTADSLSAALASTRAHHAETDAAQAAFLIDALVRLRTNDVEGASQTLDYALEPMVQQLDAAENSQAAAAARELVRRYGESRVSRAPENPGLAALTGVRILPAYDGGRMIGLRLRSIEPGSPFAAAGLTEDDIISAVGEMELHTHRDAVSGMRLMKAGEVTILHVVDASGHERKVGWPPQP